MPFGLPLLGERTGGLYYARLGIASYLWASQAVGFLGTSPASKGLANQAAQLSSHKAQTRGEAEEETMVRR